MLTPSSTIVSHGNLPHDWTKTHTFNNKHTTPTGERQAPFTHGQPCPPPLQLPRRWMPLASNKMSVGHAQVTHHTHIHVHTHRHTVRNVRGPCPVMYLMERKGKCQLFLKMAASSCVGYKVVAVDWCCQTYGQHISLSWCMCSVAYLLQWIASMLNWAQREPNTMRLVA